jgi:hypothetical protein
MTDLVEHVIETAFSVGVAILPLLVLFVGFQVFMLRLPRRQIREILAGTVLATLGLYLFLLGVSIGFLPYGRAMGEALGRLGDPVVLAGVGLFLGFATTWGEPAVRILAKQVEGASNGSIRAWLVVLAVCIGVGAWVAVGLLRIHFGLPLLYLVLPGYLLAIVMIRACDRDFVAIAIDAGGVATGPIANTFLLAAAFGVAVAMGVEDPISQGFGFVALIALAPILSVTALGMLMRRKPREKE